MTTANFSTPEAVEQAFYRAIENRDLTALMAVWLPGEEAVCIHPLGPRLCGAEAIRQGWQRIIESGARLRFTITGVHQVVHDDWVMRVVFEHIWVLDAEEQPNQPIIATNLYRRDERGWWLLLHHAAPGPSDQGYGGEALH